MFDFIAGIVSLPFFCDLWLKIYSNIDFIPTVIPGLWEVQFVDKTTTGAGQITASYTHRAVAVCPAIFLPSVSTRLHFYALHGGVWRTQILPPPPPPLPPFSALHLGLKRSKHIKVSKERLFIRTHNRVYCIHVPGHEPLMFSSGPFPFWLGGSFMALII